ncbi:hypothetical protein ACFQZ2_05475 [Streptomonospora algeriensis]|uniref:Uncharacterized protein n=1 Tax=Streptomonospora algeriensis TaxID=995084 RepID=A0ABW3B9L1_9ACTN
MSEPESDDNALARAAQNHDDAIQALTEAPTGEVRSDVLAAHSAKAVALAQLSTANAVMALTKEAREIRKELKRGRK